MKGFVITIAILILGMCVFNRAIKWLSPINPRKRALAEEEVDLLS